MNDRRKDSLLRLPAVRERTGLPGAAGIATAAELPLTCGLGGFEIIVRRKGTGDAHD